VSRPTTPLFVLGLVALLVVGCGGAPPTEAPDGAAVDAEDGQVEPVADGAGADLVIWADQQPIPALRELTSDFQEDTGLRVAVQEVNFDEIRGQLQSAGPAGEGPDLVVGANDWLGELVTNGAIASVELPDEDAFEDVALEAFTWDGRLYGVPYAIENLALYRNTDLVPEEPATWEEVEETALELQEQGEVARGLTIPSSREEAPYHYQPLFTALGGYVFGQLEDGTYDEEDVGLDTEGAVAAAERFRGWVAAGLLNPDVDGGIQQEQFGAGEVAFAVSGPWALRQDGAGFEETGVPFGVSPIPPLEGETARPFVGVQGMMLSAFSDDPLLAKTFLNEVMAQEPAQLAMFEANRRPPALTSALEQVVDDDPAMAAFGEAGLEGQPLPAVPAMSTVFSALGDAYRLITTGGTPPEQAMEAAATQVRAAVEAE
jgi:arabinogalactan oligomer / maltooligosaccharide transport system substrate-binding protein